MSEENRAPQIHFAVTPAFVSAVDHAAATEGATRSQFVRQLVRRELLSRGLIAPDQPLTRDAEKGKA